MTHRLASIVICFAVASCSSVPTAGVTNRASTGGATFLLEAAYRTQNIASLCFIAQARGQSEQRRLTLSMPMPDGVWELPKSSTPSQIQWAPGADSIAWKKCGAEGQAMKILEVEQDQKIELPAGVNEAIYVAYHENRVAALGYVSAQPFFGEHHRYTLVLSGLIEQVNEQDDTSHYAKAAKKALTDAGRVASAVAGGVILVLLLNAWVSVCGKPEVTCGKLASP